MAVAHIAFNDQTQHGRLLRQFLNGLETSLDTGNDVLDVMAKMLDGNGSDASHFAYFVSKFGFATTADAKAAFDELNSIMFKLNTDASVTSVNAAMKQVIAKLR